MRRTRSAIARISSSVNAFPVGLCGELSTRTFERGVSTRARASMSSRHSPSSIESGTPTATPPASRTWP